MDLEAYLLTKTLVLLGLISWVPEKVPCFPTTAGEMQPVLPTPEIPAIAPWNLGKVAFAFHNLKSFYL